MTNVSDDPYAHLRANASAQKQTTVDRLRRAITQLEAEGHPVNTFTIKEVSGLDYMAYYRESFHEATRAFDANPEALIKAMFTRGNPDGAGKRQLTADIRRERGWFGGAGESSWSISISKRRDWKRTSTCVRKSRIQALSSM